MIPRSSSFRRRLAHTSFLQGGHDKHEGDEKKNNGDGNAGIFHVD